MVSGFFGAGLRQDLDWHSTKSTIFEPRRKSPQIISLDDLCSGDLFDPEPSEGFQMPPSYLEVGCYILALGLVVPIDLVDDQL